MGTLVDDQPVGAHEPGGAAQDPYAGAVEQLAELNTDAVEPMAHALEMANIFKSDEVAESLPVKEALANSPHHDAQFYLVPAVLGE